MRYTLTVVLSCIGLSFGFIVPSGSGVLGAKNEIKSKRAFHKIEQNAQSVTNQQKKIVNNTNIQEIHKNILSDGEIYEHSNGKESNISERSFIYIKQKFKTPTVNQLYSTSDMLKDSFQLLIADDSNIGTGSAHHPMPNVSDKNNFYAGEIRSDEAKVSFPGIIKDKTTNKEHISDISSLKNIINSDRREYTELLNIPLVRPINMDTQKHVANTNQQFYRYDKERSNFPTGENFQRRYNNNDKSINNKNTHYPTYTGVKFSNKNNSDYYGFPIPYKYRSSNQNVRPNPQNNYDKANNNIKQLLTDNDKINKLLDHYLKDSLENEIIRDQLNGKIDCDYKSCNAMARKQYVNSRPQNEDCKCQRPLNIKLRESGALVANTTYKEEATANTEGDSISPLNEIGEYGDLMNEEANLKALIAEK